MLPGFGILRMMLTRSTGLGLLLAVVLAATATSQQVFRSGIDVATVGVTVLDRKGALVKDLKREDFEIIEDGQPQRLEYFAAGEEAAETAPLHLGLLFDTSGSMTDDVKFSRSAAIKFLRAVSHPVDVTLVDFDTEVRVARYGPADFPRLIERIRGRAAEGQTALYDAVGVYLNGAEDQDGRKILVLYTDGGDTSSSMTFSECLSLLRMSDATMYAIGFLEHQSTSARNTQQLYLAQMAELTGGQAYFPLSLDELDKMYGKILDEIAARYTLGYLSTNQKTDGAWRSVQVRIKRPDLKGLRIRARNGYYGPYKK